MNMRQMILVGGIICLLAGCRTPTMKGTPFYAGEERKTVGEVSDRVNLWPLAYWDDPTGSIAWPVITFSDDLFAIRPLYSQYRQNGPRGRYDEFNLLWPFIQADLEDGMYRIFPLFLSDYFQCLFPVYWNFGEYNVLFPLWHYKGRMFSDEMFKSWWNFYTLGGLAGIQYRDSEVRSSWLLPLWYEDSDGRFITPVYGKTPDAHWTFPFYYADDTGLLATPFYGRKVDAYWILPLCYQDSDTFVSSFYMHGDKGTTTWWAIPSLLAWGNTGYEGTETVHSDGKILLGIGSWSFEHNEPVSADSPDVRSAFIEDLVGLVFLRVGIRGRRHRVRLPVPGIPVGAFPRVLIAVVWMGRTEGGMDGRLSAAPVRLVTRAVSRDTPLWVGTDMALCDAPLYVGIDVVLYDAVSRMANGGRQGRMALPDLELP